MIKGLDFRTKVLANALNLITDTMGEATFDESGSVVMKMKDKPGDKKEGPAKEKVKEILLGLSAVAESGGGELSDELKSNLGMDEAEINKVRGFYLLRFSALDEEEKVTIKEHDLDMISRMIDTANTVLSSVSDPSPKTKVWKCASISFSMLSGA